MFHKHILLSFVLVSIFLWFLSLAPTLYPYRRKSGSADRLKPASPVKDDSDRLNRSDNDDWEQRQQQEEEERGRREEEERRRREEEEEERRRREEEEEEQRRQRDRDDAKLTKTSSEEVSCSYVYLNLFYFSAGKHTEKNILIIIHYRDVYSDSLSTYSTFLALFPWKVVVESLDCVVN